VHNASLIPTTTTTKRSADRHRCARARRDRSTALGENPLPTAARTAAAHNFQTPIDEIDAAARVLDPVCVRRAGACARGRRSVTSYG